MAVTIQNDIHSIVIQQLLHRQPHALILLVMIRKAMHIPLQHTATQTDL